MKIIRHIFIIPSGEGCFNALIEWLKENKTTYFVALGQNLWNQGSVIRNERKLLIIDEADKAHPDILEEIINDRGIETVILMTHDKNFNIKEDKYVFNKYAFANLVDFTRDLDKLLIKKLTKKELKKMLVKYYIGGFDSIKPALEDCREIGEAYDNGQGDEIENALREVVSEIKTMYGLK